MACTLLLDGVKLVANVRVRKFYGGRVPPPEYFFEHKVRFFKVAPALDWFEEAKN
jgi:hypothetical protein